LLAAGGRARRRPCATRTSAACTPPSTLRHVYDFEGLHSVGDIQRVVEIGVLGALELENSLSRSRTLGYLAQVALRALEVGELEERVALIESTLNPRIPSKRAR
jgi:hypothetical protein